MVSRPLCITIALLLIIIVTKVVVVIIITLASPQTQERGGSQASGSQASRFPCQEEPSALMPLYWELSLVLSRKHKNNCKGLSLSCRAHQSLGLRC